MKRFAIVTVLLALLAVTASAYAAGLSGTYKTKITGSNLAGAWAIKFSHGNYKVPDNGTAVVRGKYTVSGSKLSMKDTGGPLACTGNSRFPGMPLHPVHRPAGP